MTRPLPRPGLARLGYTRTTPSGLRSCPPPFLVSLFLTLLACLFFPPLHAAPRPDIHRVLVYDCESDIGHRKVALFDDGTILLEEGPPEGRERTLHTLDPDRLESFLVRLRQADRPERYTDPSVRGLGGRWVERCRLEVTLPGEERLRMSFARYDSLSLSVGALVRIAEDVLREVREAAPESALPPDYEPRTGDVLKRRDGQRFRVVRRTGDETGLELEGLDQPLTLYVPLGALRNEFTVLLSRREP